MSSGIVLMRRASAAVRLAQLEHEEPCEYGASVNERQIERNGRIWTIRQVSRAEAEELDFEACMKMTPEERVAAVAFCLLSCLKTRGINEIPRLRRVHRLISRQRRELDENT